MCSRWAQNSTAVVLQVRFAKSWTGPSGHWGQRYSTKGGEGLIEQNAEGINDLLKLHFNSSTNAFAMEIVGQIGTKRWRFQVPQTVLFAEVTQKVQHEISFRNAKGSMQMSKGAQLPELRVYFLKKIRGFYWSRFAADPETSLEWTETRRIAGTIALDGVVAEADIWQLEKMDVSLAGGVEGAADADRETLLSLDAQTQALSGLRYYEAAPSAAVDENDQNGAAAASSSAFAKRSSQALSVAPYVSKIGVVFSAASDSAVVVTCGRIVARDRVLLEDVVAEVKPFTDANPNAGLVSGELKLQLSDPRSTSGVHVYFARAGIGETVKVAPELPDPSESVSCSGGRVELEDVESGPFGQKNGLTTWRLRDLRFPAGTNQLISVPYRGDVEGVRERVVQIQDSQKPKRLAAVVMTEDEYLVPGVVSVGFTPSFRDNSATGIAVYEAFNCNKARNSTASSSDVAPSGTDVSQDHDYAAGELQSRSKEEVEFLEGMTHHCKAYEARVQSGELERLQQGASASPGKNLSHADREKRKALELYRSHGLLQVRAVAQEGTARLQDEEVGNINIQRNKAARQKVSLATSSHRGPVRYAGRNVDAFLVFAVNDVGESDEWFIKTGVEDKVMTQLERNSRKDFPDNELRRYLRHAEDLYVEKSKHFPNAETVEAMRELIKFVGRDEELYRLSVTVEEDEAGAKNAAMRREL
eukprot:g15892.t1